MKSAFVVLYCISKFCIQTILYWSRLQNNHFWLLSSKKNVIYNLLAYILLMLIKEFAASLIELSFTISDKCRALKAVKTLISSFYSILLFAIDKYDSGIKIMPDVLNQKSAENASIFVRSFLAFVWWCLPFILS